MPRAPKARPVATADAIRLFAEHHIVAVRKARRSGEIIAVKHSVWGWISPADFYWMQEIHRLLPEIVQGGYRFNALVYASSIEVTGIGLPVGGALAGISEIFALNDLGSQDPAIKARGALFAAAPLIPFGAMLSILRLIIGVVEIDARIAELVGWSLKTSPSDSAEHGTGTGF